MGNVVEEVCFGRVEVRLREGVWGGIGFWFSLSFFAWDKVFLLLQILSKGRSICFGCRAVTYLIL